MPALSPGSTSIVLSLANLRCGYDSATYRMFGSRWLLSELCREARGHSRHADLSESESMQELDGAAHLFPPLRR